MTTVSSDNIINIAVKGNFDDCQNLIKKYFLMKTIRNQKI